MKKITLLVIFISSLFLQKVNAQSLPPTWSTDVACIVYSHCSNCHNPTSIAPFSLLTYQDALLNMSSMKQDVMIGKMPPYLPDTKYQHYADERVLTTQEINTIKAWVDAGGPRGDTTLAPPQPVFTSSVVITNPNLTARMPAYTIPNTGGDLYRAFILTNPITTPNQYISEIEVIPGNRSAVHHVLVFQDTASAALTALDSADAGPGYTSFGGIGTSSAKLINGWVPGSTTSPLPTNMGIKITQNSRIVIQVHYPNGSQGKTDSTRINLKFITGTGIRDVSVAPILNHQTSMTDGPLSIPANTVKTFHEHFTIPVDVTVLAVAPHSHLVCTSMKAYGVTSVGDTIPLIDIPKWDFHWQGGHAFRKPIKVPGGTQLYGVATYDNTTNNPENPNSPPQTVNLGESTTDEMMLFYFTYLYPYVSGDENIVVDTASHQPHYMNCVSSFVSTNTGIATIEDAQVKLYPNPAQNVLNYECSDEVKEISLIDITGKVVKQVTNPTKSGYVNIQDMAGGLYLIRIKDHSGNSNTHRFIKD